ncbi:tumor necrosis factor receptor superfamily member 10A-like isoform X2 [Dromaius novaehollandiae]|uniref:tumor necrosis factor receptor superfamily member 10A-like isoform X2 n=1 Tax=Dromaius novaehollandiae TaxID=8790 RepID=UPI00311EE25E
MEQGMKAASRLQEAFWGTAAVALHKRDKLDHLDLSRGREDFYQVQDGDHYCKKCPAGTYVAEHCKVQNGSSKCLPCKEDEYIEYPNDFSKCLGCRTCREDQVQLSPCKATKDTQCACKNGTFCSPDHPCEMCQKCQARCPEGEVERAPCTPHSDLQCGPPTDAFPSSQQSMIVILVVVLTAVFVSAICLYLCFCNHRSHGGGGRDLRRKSSSVVDYIMLQLRRCARGSRERQDNNHNERVIRDQQQELLPTASGSVVPSAPVLEEVVPGVSHPGVKGRKKLVPAQGEDPVILLRRSFDVFAREVPYKDWKRYGRALDLLENDIALAEMNDKYSLEPFFQMLNTWQNRQGMKASVNMLLETLDRIDLGGVAGDISFRLIQQGFYQYEVS